MWEDGNLLEKEGSEGGQVLKDEIYEKGCRVTLEKCPKYYAITCGVFGAFCHTVFCDEKKAWFYMNKSKMNYKLLWIRKQQKKRKLLFINIFLKNTNICLLGQVSSEAWFIVELFRI